MLNIMQYVEDRIEIGDTVLEENLDEIKDYINQKFDEYCKFNNIEYQFISEKDVCLISYKDKELDGEEDEYIIEDLQFEIRNYLENVIDKYIDYKLYIEGTEDIYYC